MTDIARYLIWPETMTSVPLRFFYDTPVYRLAEDRYYRDRNAYVEALYPEGDPLRDLLMSKNRRFHEDAYGGAWLFYEIIGYIRLHFLGTQVRGEYFAVQRKRIVRTRCKQLKYQTWNLASEREIPSSASSEQIYLIVLEYIDACRKELKHR